MPITACNLIESVTMCSVGLLYNGLCSCDIICFRVVHHYEDIVADPVDPSEVTITLILNIN